MRIAHYDTPEELAHCYALMCKLRSKLRSKAEFISQVQRQQKQGYRLAGMEQNGKPVALAGYRLLENFIHGRFCYIDDLVTAPAARRQGVGADLLHNLAVIAREYGCSQIVLDTAISNTQAQAFYQFSGFSALGLHFYRELN